VSPDRNDPFALFLSAHRRIEEELVRLDAISGTRTEPVRVADADALEAVRSALEFFAGPAAHHSELEERVLFPQLRPLAAFAVMLPAIEAQHRMIDAEYASLRAEVDRGGPSGLVKLRALVARFAEMHRGHLIAEEKVLFPLAAHELSAAAKEEIALQLSRG
jgi:iron-sulfur cluster repair protein YtfE (RIC family)